MAAYIPGPAIMHGDVNVVLVRQFIRMVLSKARGIANVGNVYIVWDKRLNKDATNYRKLLLGSVYKQNRDHSKNDHIFKAIDVLIPILASMGIRNVFPYSLEGDDVMAWLARHHCKKCVIITADEDMWQLINENVTILNPKKGMITLDNFATVCPVPLDKYVLWKCILGDGSDFVKGLDGYGKKKAPNLAINFNPKTLDPKQLQTLELNRQMLDLEYSLTQSPVDIQAFESQIAFHESNTKFDKEKYISKVGDIGLLEMADNKTITAIQQLSKAGDLLRAFAGVTALQQL